ncbi:MAG: secretin N-terminal domain-containing protein [Bacillota bacterium]|nr:secretin N-terminal domain-containing protein [Bacillota bacterium]
MGKRSAGRCLLQAALLICLAVAGPVQAGAGFSGQFAGGDFPAVTLEVKGADVRDVLQMLSRLGSLNIVADRTVKGEVSFSFTEVPFSQALDLVLKAAGLEGRLVNSRTVFVTAAAGDRPAESLRVEVFTLKHAEPAEVRQALSVLVADANLALENRSRSILVRGTPEQLEQARQIVARIDVPRPAGAEPARPLAAPVEEPGKKRVEVVTLRFAKAEEVKNALGLVLPANAVLAESRTNSLVLNGTPEELAEARRLIDRLDTGVSQILIEARLEEISKDALTELGIEWPEKWELKDTELAKLGGPVPGVNLSYTAYLKALEEKGEARLLANPRIAVVNNQEAKIHIGDRIPVAVEEIRDGVPVTKIDYINVGIELTVTPRLNGSDSLTATVKPQVSTIVGWTPGGYPQIRTREAFTVLRMNSGQTVAIGGLKQLTEVKDRNGIVGLSNLPIVGGLFSRRKNDAKESELVIFITAHILQEGEGPSTPALLPPPATDAAGEAK